MGGRATALDIPLMKIGDEYCKDGIFQYTLLPCISESMLMVAWICTPQEHPCAQYTVTRLKTTLIPDDLAAERILHTDNLPKHLQTYGFMLPILGKTSLVTVYGDYWKKVRKMFNPAFAVSHLETLIPGIIEESMDFVDILDTYATSGEEIKLGQRLPVSQFS